MKTSSTPLVPLLGAMLTTLGPALAASGAPVVFNTPPFAGTTALETPGRQIIGNEQFVPDFDFGADVFVIDEAAFGVSSLTVQNSTAAALPLSGVNVVVLRDTDSDANPATSFLAGTAAGLIASAIDAPTPASSSTTTAIWR